MSTRPHRAVPQIRPRGTKRKIDFDFVVYERPVYVPGSGPPLAPISVLPNHDNKDAFIKDYVRIDNKSQFDYLVGYHSIPELQVQVKQENIRDWVSARTLEDWEFEQTKLKQKQLEEELLPKILAKEARLRKKEEKLAGKLSRGRPPLKHLSGKRKRPPSPEHAQKRLLARGIGMGAVSEETPTALGPARRKSRGQVEEPITMTTPARPLNTQPSLSTPPNARGLAEIIIETETDTDDDEETDIQIDRQLTMTAGRDFSSLQIDSSQSASTSPDPLARNSSKSRSMSRPILTSTNTSRRAFNLPSQSVRNGPGAPKREAPISNTPALNSSTTQRPRDNPGPPTSRPMKQGTLLSWASPRQPSNLTTVQSSENSSITTTSSREASVSNANSRRTLNIPSKKSPRNGSVSFTSSTKAAKTIDQVGKSPYKSGSIMQKYSIFAPVSNSQRQSTSTSKRAPKMGPSKYLDEEGDEEEDVIEDEDDDGDEDEEGDDDDDDAWEVEKILGEEMRIENGRKVLYYLVDWVGDWEPTYEPAENVQAPEVLTAYQKMKQRNVTSNEGDQGKKRSDQRTKVGGVFRTPQKAPGNCFNDSDTDQESESESESDENALFVSQKPTSSQGTVRDKGKGKTVGKQEVIELDDTDSEESSSSEG